MVRDIFRGIATIPTGRKPVGATATVKIMHLVNPDLFMMNDLNIRVGRLWMF